jgi:hypothetical protein
MIQDAPGVGIHMQHAHLGSLHQCRNHVHTLRALQVVQLHLKALLTRKTAKQFPQLD